MFWVFCPNTMDNVQIFSYVYKPGLYIVDWQVVLEMINVQ